MLKPKGGDGVELRVKSVAAKVQIRGQFGETTNTMTFANESSRRIEADFLMTVPVGAVVTYFAYWYGEEKVVARIVEKERAAAIYQHITSRMRDPALVEMIGKNTFRARIFPVMPNADLRVEMRWVQVLASTPTGLQYRFPLAPEVKGKGVLDNLDLQIAVASDVGITRASNNYQQPIARNNGRLSMKLKQQNFQPTADFVLNLEQRVATTPPPALRAQIFAAPSSGADGFFALALTANRNVQKPRVKIRGLTTYDLAPAILPALKAGQVAVICGRYKGSGTGAIEIAGLGVSYVKFGAQAENNNLATRLWAARRIETLSASEKNRAAVLKLSTQFTLPSKWSSWLAIPQAELERFKEEKLQADLEIAGRRYVLESAKNGRNSRAAKQFKAQFEALNKQSSYRVSLNNYVYNVLQELVQQQADEKAKTKPNARKVAQLNRQIARTQMLLDAAERAESQARLRDQRLDARMQALSEQLVEEKMAGRGGSRRAMQLRSALERSAKSSRYNRSWDSIYSNQEANKAYNLANEYVRNLYEKRDSPSTAQAAKQLRNLVGRDQAQSLMNASRSNWAENQLRVLITQLAKAKYVDADETRLTNLQASIERVTKLVPSSTLNRGGYEEYSLFALMQETKQAYDSQLLSKNPDAKILRELENRVTKIYADPLYKGASGDWSTPNLATIDKTRNPLQLPKIVDLRTDVDNLDAQMRAQPDFGQRAQLEKLRREKAAKLSYATRYHLRLGDPLIAIDAPRDALQVVAVMPDGQIKRLQWNDDAKRWEARFDIPSYATEGAYEIRVIVVEKDGARRENSVRYNVDMTAPTGEGAARLSELKSADSATLRLEISGDRGTARVFALLPWGEKIELKLSPNGEHRFFALATVPGGESAPEKVTYILTDLAHNRTTIEVDVSR